MARILVVDDETQVRRMLKDLLEDEGYEVVEAENGEEGLRLYRSDPTDLVITDIIMPEKEGLESIIELRKMSPEVKIIAISGGSRFVPTACLDAAKNLGAQAVLKKPIGFEHLLAEIAKLID